MTAVPDRVLHVALRGDWEAAQAAGEYRVSSRGRTLEEEGFVHASLPHQVAGVASASYRDAGPLVLLEVETAGLDVRMEAIGTSAEYPHVYGPIPVSAVLSVTPYEVP